MADPRPGGPAGDADRADPVDTTDQAPVGAPEGIDVQQPAPPGAVTAEEMEGADALAERLHAAQTERDQYKSLAQQVQADFENYRKRALTQQAEQVDRATGRLAAVLLPVLDACELAYQHGAEGVEPIWSKLIGELQREGLAAMDLQGQPFDPEVAEAVVHEPGDTEHPIVSEVLSTGYLWQGRVLRPAMVKVKG